MHRKLAIIRVVNELSRTVAATIRTDGYYDAGTTPGVLPGFGAGMPTDVVVSPAPDANSNLEGEIDAYLALEKELGAQQSILEVEYEAVKAEIDSLKKIVQDHAKKDFKLG